MSARKPKLYPKGIWSEQRASGIYLRWRLPDGTKPAAGPYPNQAKSLAAAREVAERLPKRRRRVKGPRPRTVLPLHEVAERWLDWARLRPRRPVKDGSEAKAAALAMAKDLGWSTCSDANATDVRELRVHRGGTGVDRPMAYLRAILRFAAQELDQPVDARADIALRAPPSEEADVELWTAEQHAEVLDKARRQGQHLLIDALCTYGWRPVTGCRILARHVRHDQTLQIGVKRNGPWVHPLFRHHHEALLALCDQRHEDEPVFDNPLGRAWDVTENHAWQVTGWFRNHCRLPGSRVGNILACKRWAIEQMARGKPPWRRALSIAEIQLFTYHKTRAQVLRYMRTNLITARSLMADEPEAVALEATAGAGSLPISKLAARAEGSGGQEGTEGSARDVVIRSQASSSGAECPG